VHTLTRNIMVMETEVTRQMWTDLRTYQSTLPMDPSETTLISPTLAHPVQRCSWYQTVFFANLLSVQNGYNVCYFRDPGFTDPVTHHVPSGSVSCDFDADGYRLPTEGEWEHFCRAGTTGTFFCNEPTYNSGNCYNCSFPTLNLYCVYCGTNPSGTLVPGSKPSNPWGFMDVIGNVGEWCWDGYDLYPIGSATDYEGDTFNSGRVTRGGGYSDSADEVRSAARENRPGIAAYYKVGFRLVRTVP